MSKIIITKENLNRLIAEEFRIVLKEYEADEESYLRRGIRGAGQVAGGVLGGALGAVGGGTAGGLAGPVGAIPGAVGGFAGGQVAGSMAGDKLAGDVYDYFAGSEGPSIYGDIKNLGVSDLERAQKLGQLAGTGGPPPSDAKGVQAARTERIKIPGDRTYEYELTDDKESYIAYRSSDGKRLGQFSKERDPAGLEKVIAASDGGTTAPEKPEDTSEPLPTPTPSFDDSLPGLRMVKEEFKKVRKKRVNEQAQTYQIKSGDTLGKIASKFDVSVKDMMDMNPQLSDPNRIQVGRKLNVSMSGRSQGTQEREDALSQSLASLRGKEEPPAAPPKSRTPFSIKQGSHTGSPRFATAPETDTQRTTRLGRAAMQSQKPAWLTSIEAASTAAQVRSTADDLLAKVESRPDSGELGPIKRQIKTARAARLSQLAGEAGQTKKSTRLASKATKIGDKASA